ncbi:MAG TPA: hypothetical protein VHL57_10870, partial [Flavobacteriales bacterium]|nr:hypothetical protein [Flavobacteriales bacterium]
MAHSPTWLRCIGLWAGVGLALAGSAAPAVLTTGDIAIVGVSACPGVNDDQVSFFCFKIITTGTTIDLTDNGYERCITGQFGNTEGTVRMTRTGADIPAGTVITFSMTNTTLITATSPDAAWSCVQMNFAGSLIELNNGGDQLIFMQGGAWSMGAVNTHNATYSGRYLAAVSTNSAFPWTASCATNPTQRSNPPPGVGCLALRVTSATAWDKYTGPITAATQKDWLLRLVNTGNWTPYGSCAAYSAAAPNWLAPPPVVMPILPPTMVVNGLW